MPWKVIRKSGNAGNRTPCLSHAKRALYHMSYVPLLMLFKTSPPTHIAKRRLMVLGTWAQAQLFALSSPGLDWLEMGTLQMD
ncbi:hypothetical protein VNO78_18410 [Psophocarpus tetragonolobus]|uniref:Uncharacterized protein n=1 Tax=Psophocarpus tetragonolobus TaxID=3891 RepID=A0AAN9XM09_PSOTE